jgi:hypothetical protein
MTPGLRPRFLPQCNWHTYTTQTLDDTLDDRLLDDTLDNRHLDDPLGDRLLGLTTDWTGLSRSPAATGGE